MRKQLRRAYWMGNAIALFFVFLFVAGMVVQDVKVDQGNLVAILNATGGWTGEASSNLYELAHKIASSAPSLRVTFMMPNGIVLADSGDQLPDGGQLLASPAVQQALKTGMGQDINWYTGWLSPTLTAAATLGEGRMILHLSDQDTRIQRTAAFVLPAFVLLVALMALAARFFLQPVTDQLMKQLQKVRGLLEGVILRDHVQPEDFYPELRDDMVNICRLIDRMRYDLEHITRTRDMQQDFVDNTSHELKSPLTSILGFAEMLEEGEGLSPAKQQEYLQYILKDARRMLAVIEDILLLQRSDGDEGDWVMVDMARTAREVRQSLKPQCGEKNITILLEGNMQVRGLEQDMWDLLRNLMSNAVRYGKEGGHVWVTMAGSTLSVRDDGIGIPKEHQEKVFEKFFRVDKGISRTAGGTGLGLSIVAGIVNRFEGAIHLDSTQGEGTCFTVSFPGTEGEGE